MIQILKKAIYLAMKLLMISLSSYLGNINLLIANHSIILIRVTSMEPCHQVITVVKIKPAAIVRRFSLLIYD